MGDYLDMPALVDRDRLAMGAPQFHMNPFPGAQTFDPFPGAQSFQPQSFQQPPAAAHGLGWGGIEPQGGTPMSWGSSMTSSMSTPMLGGPMPGLAVMPGAQSFPISHEGWPRPLANVADTPPWKDRDADDGFAFDRRSPGRAQTPLSRSISLSSSPSSGTLSVPLTGGSVSRKSSLRGNAAEALKRPPREWRTDFSLNGNGLLSGLLGNRGRSKSFGGGGADPKVVLHPYIRYTASKPPMRLDLRDSPNALRFHALNDRQLTSWDLMRFVCEPPLQFMRLYHTHLPWHVDVEAQNPAGVTLYELFRALHQCMMTQIDNADYYNVEMNGEARAAIAEAWAARCTSEAERGQGIRRVDYLVGRVIMEGIQKGKDGCWEIKTRKPTRSESHHH